MKPAAQALLAMILLLVLGACGELDINEEDRDFDANDRTTDVTLENAELIALGILHSVILPSKHLPLNEFLDASDLPSDAFLDPAGVPAGNGYLTTPLYLRNCAGGGFARYQFTRTAGEDHRAGDRVLLEFENCINANGVTRNGRVSATYSLVEGLNRHFTVNSTEQCVTRLAERITGSEHRFDVSAETVLFERFGDRIRIRSANLIVPEDSQQDPYYETVESFEISDQDKAIVVNAANNAGVTSIDGDVVYSLVGTLEKQEDCQSFKRRFSLNMSDYSAQSGDLALTLNGSVAYEQETYDNITRVSQIDNSAFTLTATEGRVTNSYYFYNAGLILTENSQTRAQVIKADGLMRSNAVFGTVEFDETTTMLSNKALDFPSSGSLQILGRGLERIRMFAFDTAMTVSVDFDGDRNGDTFPDYDQNIFTSWSELLARDFVEAQP
ncbi:MAG: hypothetical protein R3183_02990 [Oleiphilaceae bacterium]|nr:hypothetical protein [Oleiphilaceae bacterium]